MRERTSTGVHEQEQEEERTAGKRNTDGVQQGVPSSDEASAAAVWLGAFCFAPAGCHVSCVIRRTRMQATPPLGRVCLTRRTGHEWARGADILVR
jgi:hypothetical protein